MERGRGAYEKVRNGGKFTGQLGKSEKEMSNRNFLVASASPIQFVAVEQVVSLAKAVC